MAEEIMLVLVGLFYNMVNLMKKHFGITIIAFIIIEALMIITPDTQDITGKDFKISKTDILIKNIFQIQFPDKQIIQPFNIWFSLGNADRVGIIDIYFSNNENIIDTSNMLFNNLLLHGDVRLIENTQNKQVYLGEDVQFILYYLHKDKQYHLLIMPIDN